MTRLPYIVCGWYTPDYRQWADALRENLSYLGERHDIVEVPPMCGGWERNTMRKPEQLLAAMERHPDDVIILLDVDCEVRRGLDALCRIKGDAGLYFRGKIHRNGVSRLNIRSGTMVVRNTEPALRFIRKWIDLGREAPRGTVDQATLPIAMATTPGLTVDVLGNEFCAVPADGVPNPTILHDSASRYTPKVSRLLRTVNRVLNRKATEDES